MKKVELSFIVKDEDVDEITNELMWGDMGAVADYLNSHCEESDYEIIDV